MYLLYSGVLILCLRTPLPEPRPDSDVNTLILPTDYYYEMYTEGDDNFTIQTA